MLFRWKPASCISLDVCLGYLYSSDGSIDHLNILPLAASITLLGYTYKYVQTAFESHAHCLLHSYLESSSLIYLHWNVIHITVYGIHRQKSTSFVLVWIIWMIRRQTSSKAWRREGRGISPVFETGSCLLGFEIFRNPPPWIDDYLSDRWRSDQIIDRSIWFVRLNGKDRQAGSCSNRSIWERYI